LLREIFLVDEEADFGRDFQIKARPPAALKFENGSSFPGQSADERHHHNHCADHKGNFQTS
jgi:hypothetical protein